ncbi:MAG: hypothetical protein AAFZ65_05235 [Planctomycetota bacterium]
MRPTSTLLLALAAPLASADVTVGPVGSGAAFNDLQAAIDAVQPGETVFVQAGTYAGPVLITGGIRVVGAGADQTLIASGGSQPQVEIANVGAGQGARLVGVGLVPADLGGVLDFGAGLAVRDCVGSVTVADVRYAPAIDGGAFLPYTIESLGTIENSGQVLLQDLVLDASGLVDPSGVPATRGLEAIGSRIYSLESDFIGGESADWNGASGIRLEQSTIWFTGSTAAGANGAILQTNDPVAAPLGGVGIELRDMSRLELFGGFGNSVSGGQGGGVLDATGTIPLTPGDGAPALVHTNGSSSVLAAGSSLQGGQSVDNQTQAPPSIDDGTGGLLFFLEGNFGLRADKTLVSASGEVVTLEVRGNPNAVAGTFLGLDTVPQYSVLPFFGDIQINPFLPTIIPTLNLGFGGQASLPLPVPPLPAGLAFYLQTVDLGFSFAPSASQPLLLQIVP